MVRWEEKRKHIRIGQQFIRNFQIRPHQERKGGPFALFKKKMQWETVQIIDVSAGGVLFLYDKKLEKDLLLDIRIDFYAVRDQIQCVGKVLRAQKPLDSDKFHIALLFTEINNEDQETINRIAQGYYPDSYEK